MNNTVTFVIHNAIHNCLKRSQFCVINDTQNDIVVNKKGHNIGNDSFAHKPHSFLVLYVYCL